MEIKASAAVCVEYRRGELEGEVAGIWGGELMGNGLFQTSEALTSYLDRTEAEIEVISHLPQLFLLVTLLGWKSFYSVILVFMILVQFYYFFFFF